MSAVRLGLASGPIERVSADVAVVPLFCDERPLRDTAGRIDWRLCGRLSHLFAARRLGGEPGEAVLVPGGGGVRAALVLGLGLGERPVSDDGEPPWPRWPSWARDALERASGLAARRVALGMPTFGPALPQRLAELVAAAAESGASFDLELAPEPVDRPEAADWLRRASQRSMPAGVEIQRPAEARHPHGGDDSKPPAWSSRGSAGRFTR